MNTPWRVCVRVHQVLVLQGSSFGPRSPNLVTSVVGVGDTPALGGAAPVVVAQDCAPYDDSHTQVGTAGVTATWGLTCSSCVNTLV